jgi:hypothetical protein
MSQDLRDLENWYHSSDTNNPYIFDTYMRSKAKILKSIKHTPLR